MGLASSQCRLLLIVARKSDLEFQIQLINQRRMGLAYQAANLSRQFADEAYQTGDWTTSGIPVDPTDPTSGYALPGVTDIFAPGGEDGADQQVGTADIASGDYEIAMTVIHAQDKALELRQKQLETQHTCVTTEYDAVKKVIDKNIEMSFKTLG